MNGLLQQEKLDALGRSLIHLAAKVEVFRNAAAQLLGYNRLEALVSLQLRPGSLRRLCILLALDRYSEGRSRCACYIH